MPAYRYRVVSGEGTQEIGSLTSDSLRSAKNELRSKNMTILDIEEIHSESGKQSYSTKTLFTQKLSFNELVLVTRQLASLLEASLPLEKALSALIEQAERNYTKELLTSIRAEVNSGMAFSQALSLYPIDFSETFRGLVRSGEQIGRLSTVLAQLATYLERRHSLINKVRLAFTYPAIVTVVALLVVIFLLTYVVPQVVSVFVQTQQDLPILTQVMLTISKLILDWGLLFFTLFIVLFMIFRFSLRHKNIKIKWHNFLLNFPGYGKFERTLNSVRFTSTLAISSAAGVPILEALKSSKNTLSNSVMKMEIDIVIENVREGMSLSRALSLHRNFPPILIHMTRAGEITGSLSDMLTRASKSQEDELERRTLFIANLLEPALILCMGGFVLVIVLAVLMPIIEINQLIQ